MSKRRDVHINVPPGHYHVAGLPTIAMYDRGKHPSPYNPTRFQRFMDRWFT